MKVWSFKHHQLSSVPNTIALISVVITDFQLLLFYHNFYKISSLFMVILIILRAHIWPLQCDKNSECYKQVVHMN